MQVYKGHTGLIRCISTDPTGQWLVFGSDDQTLKLWEVSTARCMKTLQMNAVIKDVAWNPNPTFSLIVVAVYVLFLHYSSISLFLDSY